MASDPAAPPSVRFIWRVRDALRSNRRRWLAILLLALVGWLGVDAVYTVDNGESAAVLRFGALVDDTIAPGLQFLAPAGVDDVTKTRTGEVFRVQVEGDARRRLDLVTGDENLIEVVLTVQYRISRLGDYLFRTENAETLVRQTIRADLVEAVAALGVDDVLTSAKALLQQQVRERSQARLDDYDSGVTLVSVNLQAVDPPREAEAAFRGVLDARAEAAETVSFARAEQDRALRLASGEAAKLLSAAEAEANTAVQVARGAAERFQELLVQKQRSPGLTRIDLFARTIREVLPRTRVIVLAPGELPDLEVNLVGDGDR